MNPKIDHTPVLDDEDANIGNATTLYPQQGAVGVVVPQPSPQRLLNLCGGSAAGQTVSVAYTARRVLPGSGTGPGTPGNPNPGFPGPVTGIIEFGNGTCSTVVELDVPVGPFAGQINQASPAIAPQDGVVVVTVPTGVVRARFRYDNLLVAPLIGTDPPQSHAQVSGVPFIGPGGPLLVADPADPNNPAANFVVPPEPVYVQAMAAWFNRPRSKVYRTLNCYLANETNAPAPANITVGTPSVSGVAAFANYAFWALPAFTKSVKILRFPDTTTLAVLLHDGIRPVDFINVGAVTAPDIEIQGNVNMIGITSGNQPVHMLKIVCELGI